MSKIGPLQMGRVLEGSDFEEKTRREFKSILAYAARNANRAGEFYRNTSALHRLPDLELLAELQRQRYDCLVARHEGNFAGFLAYQVHDGTKNAPGSHVFAYHVEKGYRQKGVSSDLQEEFLRRLWNDGGVRRARLSAGDIEAALDPTDAMIARHLYHKAVGNEHNLPCRVRPYGDTYGWIELYDPARAFA